MGNLSLIFNMENYDWQKNKAIVDRMYYTERIFETTSFFAGLFTVTNLFYIRKNYFAAHARSWLLPTFVAWAALNGTVATVLLRPLTREEIRIQWRKRLIMGKF